MSISCAQEMPWNGSREAESCRVNGRGISQAIPSLSKRSGMMSFHLSKSFSLLESLSNLHKKRQEWLWRAHPRQSETTPKTSTQRLSHDFINQFGIVSDINGPMSNRLVSSALVKDDCRERCIQNSIVVILRDLIF